MIENAFKIRAADSPIINTSQFLNLYSPNFLSNIEKDDLFIPKLIIIRGNPGSGKSSLLRLFETDSLIRLHKRRNQMRDSGVLLHLQDLNIIDDTGPKCIGIYLQCDSSLQDISNLHANQGTTLHILNTFIDIRILKIFISSIKLLNENNIIHLPENCELSGLPANDAPPSIFSKSYSIHDLYSLCERIENDFARLLNSFPGEPRPKSIAPHARIYIFKYLDQQVKQIPALSNILPIIMLDDIHILKEEQREHIIKEFIRRSSVTRWIAVRNHIYSLEKMISLQGGTEGRDFHDINLSIDPRFSKPNIFRKFAFDITERRLRYTNFITDKTSEDIKRLLEYEIAKIHNDKVNTLLNNIKKQVNDNFYSRLLKLVDLTKEEIQFSKLIEVEHLLILNNRPKSNQEYLFPELDEDNIIKDDSKIDEAAKLFLTKKLKLPYYFNFNVLADVSSGNIEQFLSVTAKFIDKMIFKERLGKEPILTALEQEKILCEIAEKYYSNIEKLYSRGFAIKQFISNLGLFCNLITYRRNAPYAPGINGFEIRKDDFNKLLDQNNKDFTIFKEMLKSGVAGNVLNVRRTKQGIKGEEKIVFYINRLLCIKYRLPLNYGGWRAISLIYLNEMMKRVMSENEIKNKLKNNDINNFNFS